MNLKVLFKKQFYINKYHQLIRKKILGDFFFDYTVLLILTGILVLGIVFLFPYEIELRVPSIDIQVYILESILRIISIFLGITFSFIILSFNIFYKYFGRYAFLDFFKIRAAKMCLTLLFSTIIITLYSIYFLKETESALAYTNFLFFFSIILSIVSFLSIFPFFISLLRTSQSRKHISQIFKMIDKEEYVINKFLARVENEKESFYQKDPFSLINEIGILSLKEYDVNTFNLINSNFKIFLEESVPKDLNQDAHVSTVELYYKFNDLLSDYFDITIKEKNEKFSSQIIKSRYELEGIILKNLHKKNILENNDFGKRYQHWDFDFDTEKFLKKALQFDADEVSINIINNYHSICTKSITKLSPKLERFSDQNRFDIATKAKIILDPFKNLKDFADLFIRAKKLYLVKEIFTSFYCIEEKILELDTHNKTKCFLFNVAYNYKKDTFLAYLDSAGNDYIESQNFPFKDGYRYFEKTNCKVPFLGMLEMIEILLGKNKLNSVIINLLKAQMLGLVRLENTELLEIATKRILKLSAYIKPDDIFYRKDMYLKFYEYLQIVNREISKEVGKMEGTKVEIKNALDSFNLKDKFQKELKETGYISDDRMI